MVADPECEHGPLSRQQTDLDELPQGRFQEGHYEISATARLAIHCGLHQIDDDIIMNVLQVPHQTSRPRSFGILGKPKDIMDLSMRIVTFWEVRCILPPASHPFQSHRAPYIY